MFLIVAMLYPAVAFAADESAKDERLVAFTQALKRPDGSNIQECTKFSDPSKDEPKATCVKLEDVTLGTLSYAALSRPKQGMSMKETAERWRLSRKIYNAVVKISKPDATLIMQAITEANFPVEYSGQAFCMLDATFCEEEKK